MEDRITTNLFPHENCGVSFRFLQKSDREGVRAFFAALGEESASYFNVGGGNEKRVMDFFENGKPDHRFFVAQTQDVLACIAFIWDVDRTIPWFGIATRDDYQGRGIGGNMIRLVTAYLKENGYGGMILRTAQSNLKAQRLYERNGFECPGTHPSGEKLYLLRFQKEGPV